MHDDAAAPETQLGRRRAQRASPSKSPEGTQLGRRRAQLRFGRCSLAFAYIFFLLGGCIVARAESFTKQDLQALNARGAAAFARGEYGDAVGLFERLTRVNVARDQYWLNYGAALVELGRHRESIIAFRRAIQLRGKLMLAAALQLAEAYRREGDTVHARRTLGWLVKQKKVPAHILSEALALSARVDETYRSRDEFDELVNRGIWRYKNKRYLDAYSAWNGALQIRRSWEVFFLVALAQIEVGQMDSARKTLTDVEAGTEDEDLKAAARQIRTDILSVKRSKYYVNAELATGYAAIAFESVHAPSANLEGQARVGYRLFELEEWRGYARYRAKWNQLVAPTANTLMTQNVGGALGYDSGSWLLELKLDLELNHFSDQLFLFRVLTGWSVGHRWEDSRLALTVLGSTNTVPADAYEYLSGRSGIVKLGWTYIWGEKTKALELYGRYGVDDVGDSDLGPTSIIPVANVEHEAGQTIRYGLGPFVTLKQGLALGRRRYRKNVEPGGSRRRDTRFTANLGMSFRQSLAWTYDLDLMYVLNNSNANASSPSDQRFHETSIRFSMLWDIVP